MLTKLSFLWLSVLQGVFSEILSSAESDFISIASGDLSQLGDKNPSQTIDKPNFCKPGACIKCVDKGDYYGCEKCIGFVTDQLASKCTKDSIPELQSK